MIFSLLQRFTTTFPRPTRRRVRATFLEWRCLRCAHIAFRVRPVDELPRTFLPIFGTDPRRVQHPCGGLGDAFGTDARAARWGEICASRPVSREVLILDTGIRSVLTFLSSVARAQCVLRVYVASLNSRLADEASDPSFF
jgi:hypothetical protein